MLDYASKSFTTRQEKRVNELEALASQREDELGRQKEKFDGEAMEYQQKVQSLTDEMEKLKTECENLTRDPSYSRKTTRSGRTVKEINVNLLHQLAEDNTRKRSRKGKRSVSKLADSELENTLYSSNEEEDEDEEFEPEVSDDEQVKKPGASKSRKQASRRKPAEYKRMKKNETKDAMMAARNTINYHLFN